MPKKQDLQPSEMSSHHFTDRAIPFRVILLCIISHIFVSEANTNVCPIGRISSHLSLPLIWCETSNDAWIPFVRAVLCSFERNTFHHFYWVLLIWVFRWAGNYTSLGFAFVRCCSWAVFGQGKVFWFYHLLSAQRSLFPGEGIGVWLIHLWKKIQSISFLFVLRTHWLLPAWHW